MSGLFADVPAGAILAIMGPSGAGKTTLLRAVASLTTVQAGSIDVHGQRVGMVFQDPRLLPWRTAMQNVALVLDVAERSQARDYLARVGLADAAHAYPGALSGGMRQRVAIARALAVNAPVILVDEPFSSLDLVTADQLREDLTEQLCLAGHTALWVTHQPAEAARVADRTLLLAGPPTGSWRWVEHNPDASITTTTALLESELRRAATRKEIREDHE